MRLLDKTGSKALGHFGRQQHRPGFERLLSKICGGQVGAAVLMEASRLARNGPPTRRAATSLAQ
jgi:DNA invertase Pin-like site-specific DNA recombinase